MGEISYRPLIEAMTWSYSRLEIFDDCPYRWFLTYIHTPKLKKEDKFYAAYGLFMHDLLEKYFKGENSKEEILMMFLTQFKAKTKGTGRPKAATVQKYFQSGTEFIKSLEPLRFKMISVEEKIDFKIGEFNFTGRIDYLGEEDGEFVIIDNKSRDLKPRSGREKPTLKDKELDLMLRQLYIYAELFSPASARAISSRWAWLLEGGGVTAPASSPGSIITVICSAPFLAVLQKNGGHTDEIDVSPASASRSDHTERAAVPLWDRHIHSISLYFPSTK